MPSLLDKFMPRTAMRFPDGAVLCVGTISCDDQIHQAVYLSYTPAGASEPSLELELPPRTVDVIIQQFQEYANHARFINGERMVEYPKPYPGPAIRPGVAPRKRKAKQRPAKKSGPGAASEGGPASQLGHSGATEEPPSVG